MYALCLRLGLPADKNSTELHRQATTSFLPVAISETRQVESLRDPDGSIVALRPGPTTSYVTLRRYDGVEARFRVDEDLIRFMVTPPQPPKTFRMMDENDAAIGR